MCVCLLNDNFILEQICHVWSISLAVPYYVWMFLISVSPFLTAQFTYFVPYWVGHGKSCFISWEQMKGRTVLTPQQTWINMLFNWCIWREVVVLTPHVAIDRQTNRWKMNDRTSRWMTEHQDTAYWYPSSDPCSVQWYYDMERRYWPNLYRHQACPQTLCCTRIPDIVCRPYVCATCTVLVRICQVLTHRN